MTRPFAPLALLIVLLLGATSALSAQGAGLPAGPGVAAARGLLRQISAESPGRDLDFVRAHFSSRAFRFSPDTTIAGELASLRRHGGGLTVDSAERRGSAVSFRARTRRTGTPVRLDVVLDGDSIIGYNVLIDHFWRSGPPPALPEARVVPDSVVPIVRRWLGWWERNDRWSGTVAIARRDTSVLVAGVGLADRARGLRADSATRYHLGSSNKMLTAIAIGQLVDRGQLHFDDTLARVLPSYPDRDVAARVTIRQLLTHTAGLGGLFELPAYDKRRRYGSNLALLSVLRGRPLLFPPGSRYQYSNEGFVVLGAVIEQVSGMGYEQYVRANILAPAGMSGWCDCMGRRGDAIRAVGYSQDETDDPFGEDAPTDNERFIGEEGLAAGGYYATATDYLRFAHALRTSLLLSDSTRALMWTANPMSGALRPYGMGFVLSPVGGRAAVGHGGGGGRSGVGVEFTTLRDGEWTVAVFGNRDLYLAREVARPLLEFLARQ